MLGRMGMGLGMGVRGARPSLEMLLNAGFADNSVWFNPASADYVMGGGALDLKNLTISRTYWQDTQIVAGQSYKTIIAIDRFANSNVRVGIGGTLGTFRAAAGVFEEVLVAGATNQRFSIIASANADLRIDYVSLTPA